MKKTKRLLLVLPIVALLVAVLWAPATTSAAPKTKYEQLSATGLVSYIDEGNVKQLPNGRWLVKDRNVSGAFTGGAFAGLDFGLTYNGLIESALTQVGVFQGEMSIGSQYQARIWGATGITEMYPVTPAELPAALVPFLCADITGDGQADVCSPLPRLSFGGAWNFTGTTHGFGQFSGSFVFVPNVDAQGNPHVGMILPNLSDITVTGLWRQ